LTREKDSMKGGNFLTGRLIIFPGFKEGKWTLVRCGGFKEVLWGSLLSGM
jgi:hypothetical protein